MIEFTIKTLDAKDHHFVVDDDITVAQLKLKVLEQMGVEVHLQRLIFCGRVLQEEKKLADYGVHGKVIHMVQRPPPCLEAESSREPDREWVPPPRPRDRDRIAVPIIADSAVSIGQVHMNNAAQHQITRLLAMAAAAHAHGVNIDEHVPAAFNSPTAARLDFLRRMAGEIRATLDTIIQNENLEPRTFPSEDPMPARNAAGPFSTVPREVICPVHQSPILYQIDHGLGTARQDRRRRHRTREPVYHTPPSDFGQVVQDLHSMDAEFAPYRDRYIRTLRDASDDSVRLPEEELQRRQRTAELCAQLYHSFSHAYHTVSDIGLLLSHSNSRVTSEALMRHPLPVHAHINVVQASPQRRSINASTVNGSVQALSANEAHDALNEIENMFRSVGGVGGAAVGGVEVVMSMEEEIPGDMGGPNDAVPDDGSPPDADGHVFAQTLLHNIVASVFHQGLIPGLEEAVQQQQAEARAQAQAQTQEQAQNQAQTQPQTQAQTQPQAQTQLQAQTQPQPQGQPQTQSQCQPQGQTQCPGQGEGQTETRPQTENQAPPQSPPQAPTSQQWNEGNNEQDSSPSQSNHSDQQDEPLLSSHTVSIFNLVYDRFLPCDSQHAHNQLQRRRQESVRAGGPRLGETSIARIQVKNNVETLFERFDRYSVDEESLVISATLTLHESTSFIDGRVLIASELHVLRRRLQVYMRDLMGTEYVLNTQAQLADRLFERHGNFINRIASITPMRPTIDVPGSMRAVFVRFLNEAMIVLYSVNPEEYYRRFRIIFARTFYELCGVVSYCCLEGVLGLKRIFCSFVHDMYQNVEEPVRDLLHSLAMNMLQAGTVRVEAQRIHYPQFIRHLDVPCCSFTPQRASVETTCTTNNQALFITPDIAVADPDEDTDVLECADESDESEESEEESSEGAGTSRETERNDGNDSETDQPKEPAEADQKKEPEENKETHDVPSASSTNAAEINTPEKKETDKSEKKSDEKSDPMELSDLSLTNINIDDDTVNFLKGIELNVAALSPVSLLDTSTSEEASPRPARTRPQARVASPASSARAPPARSRARARRSRLPGLDSPPTTSPESPDTERFEPPAQLVHYWGEELVPTLARDMQQQQRRQQQPAEPYSDAYLSGMPPRKRRCVRQNRPPATLEGVINHNASDAAAAAAVAAVATPRTGQLRTAVTSHVRRSIATRSAASADYEPRRFKATERFLKKPRNVQQAPENKPNE